MKEPAQGMEGPTQGMKEHVQGMEDPTQGMEELVQGMEGPTCHPTAKSSRGAKMLPSGPAVPCLSCKPIEHRARFSPASPQALPSPWPQPPWSRTEHPRAAPDARVDTHTLSSSSIKDSDS